MKIKNCPFCGKIPKFAFSKFSIPSGYELGCEESKCKVVVRTFRFLTKKTAIKWWNKRPIEDELEGLIDELQLDLENIIE